MQHQPIRKFTAEHMAARDGLLNEALRVGKFQLSSFQDWQRRYDADPEGTKTWIATLQAAPAGVAASSAPPPSDRQYESNWLTEGERRRVAGVGSSSVMASVHD